MTLTPADLELSAPAAARLEEYLVQVRAALSGAADVSPDDIEADIRDHVGSELSAAPRPVALAALEAVLAKLGPPSQWGAAPDPTAFRRVGHLLRAHLRDARAAAAQGAKRVGRTLWSGPEDWRLAYLSFGVFAVGLVTMVAFPFALLVSYVLSRAGLAHARERGIELGGGRKWLLYPPVVLVSAALLVVAVAWPIGLGAATFEQVEQSRTRLSRLTSPEPLQRVHLNPDAPVWHEYPRLQGDRQLVAAVGVEPDFAPVVAGLFVGTGAFALWGVVVGVLGQNFPGAVRAVFCPLCDRFESHHGTRLGLISFLLLIAWIGTALRVLD